jgi:hypothetical protein
MTPALQAKTPIRLTLVELGEACHRGAMTVSSGMPFEEWTRSAFASGKYH